MSETLGNRRIASESKPILQPDLQPIANGTASEAPSAVVCRSLLADKVTVCGAGPKPGNPGRCTNNHFLAGNHERSPKDERPEVLEEPDEAVSLESFDVVARQVQRIERRVNHRERRLRLPLTASKRERLEKIQAADEAALVAALSLRDKLAREGRQSSTARQANVLSRLSDDTLARVLADLGVRKLEDVPDVGPLPLRLELTDHLGPQTPPQEIASPAPTSHGVKASAPVRERVPIPLEALGEETSPRLIKGAATVRYFEEGRDVTNEITSEWRGRGPLV